MRIASRSDAPEHGSVASAICFRHLGHCLILVPLPAYSPELNPVKRVWLYLRQRYLSLRVFANYRVLVDACCMAWNRLVVEPGRLRSPCDQPWIKKVCS